MKKVLYFYSPGCPFCKKADKFIAQAIEEHQEVTEALNAAIGTKANKDDLTSHTSDAVAHIESTERADWNAAKAHADSAHAPSDAEP